jgi:hypothetical protein
MSSASMNETTRTFCWLFSLLIVLVVSRSGENLIEDPSFEMPKEVEQLGLVFAKWGGYNHSVFHLRQGMG